jgi:plastocyanin
VRAPRGRWAGLLAAAAWVAGLGPGLLATAQPAWAFVGTVEIYDRAFSPKVTEIELDDKILWRNRSDRKHSVTADSGEFDYVFGTKGAQEERRFQIAKTYTYHCKFHDGMTGTVVVRDPNAPATTTTAPPPTTTTAQPTTTTTTAPPTTTTTAPAPTTTAPARPPAGVSPPPVPSTAAAPPPTLATSSTTTLPPSSTTTTAAPSTTATSAPAPAGDQTASPSTSASAPPTTESTGGGTGDDLKTAAGRPGRSDGGLDAGAVSLVTLLVAVGLFGAWTLIRVRPGRI